MKKKKTESSGGGEEELTGVGTAQEEDRELLGAAAGEPSPDPETFARSYQLEALETARKQNTIVFLETGSGKTLIAVMLLRSYAHAITKPSDHIAVFLVPTVVLVHQQAQVLEMHTNLKVGKFWGDMGVDFWDAATWNDKLRQYEVFVMTHQILLDNLRHRFFKLEKIKLLMFDECHNAKGRSPYACIMTEFYHHLLKENSVELPRIFGMTASLVNSKASSSRTMYNKKIDELESLMNSKVYTVASESVLAQYIPFPTLRIEQYKQVDLPYNFTRLLDLLKDLKTKHLLGLQELMLDSCTGESAKTKITKLYATFIFCLRELGLWSVVKAAETLSCKDNDIFFWGQIKDGTVERIARKFCKDVNQIFSNYIPSEGHIGDDLKADTNSGLLSQKVRCLIKSLLNYRMVHDLRCIVFVERVITAIVLQSLFCELKELSGWETHYMAGNSSCLQSQTRKEQMKIVDAFREGKANIIVATQILEEGLDVQSCKLVIRFDQSTNVCSFIQSRGRARMKGSEYLLIVRSGDSSSLSKVDKYIKSAGIMREESLLHASRPCKPLESEMYSEEFYCVESTGAIVNLSSSVSLIYFYCSRLPSDGYFKPFPRFVIDKVSNTCTMHLPKNCPVQSIFVEGKYSMLKQIACLEASKKLHQIGALSDYLLPVFDVAVEDFALEGQPYIEEQVNYIAQEIVDYWSSFSCLGLYHCYKISFNQDFSYETTPNEILLVVKSAFGTDFLSYSFSLETDRGTMNVYLKYVGAVHLSREQVSMARRFQISVLAMLIHKDFNQLTEAISRLNMTHSYLDFAYLLLPLVGGKIDWHCVKAAVFSVDMVEVHSSEHRCSPTGKTRWMQTTEGIICSCMLRNSIVYTPHNGKFYCITDILDDLNGNSIIKLKGGENVTYKEYYSTRHGVILRRETESLLAGRHLFQVRNFLVRRSFVNEKEFSTAGVELPPELCKVIMSPISISTIYSFSFVPCVMHRVECMLLASRLKNILLEHCVEIGQVPAVKVLEAITTKRCREAFSLESLETLGDSFLKYATGQHLFKTYKHHHEGMLSAIKEHVVSNDSLCHLGCNRKIPGFIRTEEFDLKQWVVPGYCIDLVDSQNFISSQDDYYYKKTRHIKSKVVADSVEALIGACLSTAGELAAFHFLNWLGVEVDFCKDMIDSRKVLARPETFVNVKELELLLNYKFNDPSLLVEALTHGSYQVPEIPRCYQRLEFLGDAVLDHLITLHLYNKYPGMTPGLLTDLRSASVNNDCYAHAAVKAGLNKHILHASSVLHKQMTFYLQNFGESFSGSSFGWEAGIALPKVLGDVIESLAGAIYIDSGFEKDVVWGSIRPLLEPIVSPETIEYHPVRELEELCSCKSYNKSFSMTCKDGLASITVEIEANGVIYRETCTGPNKKTAKKLAAKAVLTTIKACTSTTQS